MTVLYSNLCYESCNNEGLSLVVFLIKVSFIAHFSDLLINFVKFQLFQHSYSLDELNSLIEF